MISFAKNVRDYISCVHLFVYFSPCAWCLTTMHLSVSQRGHGASQVKLPGAAAVLSFFCVVFCFFCSHTKKKNEFSNQDSGEGWCSLTLKKKKRGTIFNGCIWCFCSLSTMLDHNAAIFLMGLQVKIQVSFGGFSFVSFTLEIVKNTEFNANNSTQLCKIFVLRMGEVGHQNRKWQNFFMFIFYLFESHLK